jgi:Anti-sigma factor NepR
MPDEFRSPAGQARFDQTIEPIGRQLRALYDADSDRRIPSRIARLLERIDRSEPRIQDVER